jgi:hypothetical protein
MKLTTLLPIIILTAILFQACSPTHTEEEESWTFVSMPDFLHVDCDYPQEGWEDALSYVLQSMKDENPDFLLVASDLVMGHWDAHEWNDTDTIQKYAPEQGSVEPGFYWLYSNWDFNVAGYVYMWWLWENTQDERLKGAYSAINQLCFIPPSRPVKL